MVYNDIKPIVFSYDYLTWYSFQDLLDCCWLFSSNTKYPYISPISCGENTVPRDIVCLSVDIVHVVIITVLGNYANMINFWWKILQ